MMRALSRWLFMRTHRAQLLNCTAFARNEKGMDSPFVAGQRDGVLLALETLEMLV